MFRGCIVILMAVLTVACGKSEYGHPLLQNLERGPSCEDSQSNSTDCDGCQCNDPCEAEEQYCGSSDSDECSEENSTNEYSSQLRDLGNHGNETCEPPSSDLCKSAEPIVCQNSSSCGGKDHSGLGHEKKKDLINSKIISVTSILEESLPLSQECSEGNTSIETNSISSDEGISNIDPPYPEISQPKYQDVCGQSDYDSGNQENCDPILELCQPTNQGCYDQNSKNFGENQDKNDPPLSEIYQPQIQESLDNRIVRENCNESKNYLGQTDKITDQNPYIEICQLRDLEYRGNDTKNRYQAIDNQERIIFPKWSEKNKPRYPENHSDSSVKRSGHETSIFQGNPEENYVSCQPNRQKEVIENTQDGTRNLNIQPLDWEPSKLLHCHPCPIDYYENYKSGDQEGNSVTDGFDSYQLNSLKLSEPSIKNCDNQECIFFPKWSGKNKLRHLENHSDSLVKRSGHETIIFQDNPEENYVSYQPNHQKEVIENTQDGTRNLKILPLARKPSKLLHCHPCPIDYYKNYKSGNQEGISIAHGFDSYQPNCLKISEPSIKNCENQKSIFFPKWSEKNKPRYPEIQSDSSGKRSGHETSVFQDNPGENYVSSQPNHHKKVGPNKNIYKDQENNLISTFLGNSHPRRSESQVICLVNGNDYKTNSYFGNQEKFDDRQTCQVCQLPRDIEQCGNSTPILCSPENLKIILIYVPQNNGYKNASKCITYSEICSAKSQTDKPISENVHETDSHFEKEKENCAPVCGEVCKADCRDSASTTLSKTSSLCKARNDQHSYLPLYSETKTCGCNEKYKEKNPDCSNTIWEHCTKLKEYYEKGDRLDGPTVVNNGVKQKPKTIKDHTDRFCNPSGHYGRRDVSRLELPTETCKVKCQEYHSDKIFKDKRNENITGLQMGRKEEGYSSRLLLETSKMKFHDCHSDKKFQDKTIDHWSTSPFVVTKEEVYCSQLPKETSKVKCRDSHSDKTFQDKRNDKSTGPRESRKEEIHCSRPPSETCKVKCPEYHTDNTFRDKRNYKSNGPREGRKEEIYCSRPPSETCKVKCPEYHTDKTFQDKINYKSTGPQEGKKEEIHCSRPPSEACKGKSQECQTDKTFQDRKKDKSTGLLVGRKEEIHCSRLSRETCKVKCQERHNDKTFLDKRNDKSTGSGEGRKEEIHCSRPPSETCKVCHTDKTFQDKKRKEKTTDLLINKKEECNSLGLLPDTYKGKCKKCHSDKKLEENKRNDKIKVSSVKRKGVHCSQLPTETSKVIRHECHSDKKLQDKRNNKSTGPREGIKEEIYCSQPPLETCKVKYHELHPDINFQDNNSNEKTTGLPVYRKDKFSNLRLSSETCKESLSDKICQDYKKYEKTVGLPMGRFSASKKSGFSYPYDIGSALSAASPKCLYVFHHRKKYLLKNNKIC